MRGVIFLNVMVHAFALGIVAIGAYLILREHPVAGGWTLAGGILAFVFGGYNWKDRKE